MTQFSSLYGTRLDRELGTDDSTVLFTTARRKSAINEGHAEFAELTECLLRRSTVTLQTGVGEVDLLSTLTDFVRLAAEPVQFRYTDASSNTVVLSGDDLPRRDLNWLDRYSPGWQVSSAVSTAATYPSVYYTRPDGPAYFLGLWPPPSTGSSASMDALVPYLARPTAMSNDTSEPFTVNSSVRTDLRIYHQALVHYGAAQLEKLRRDYQQSDRQLQQFLGYVQRYWQNVRKKGGRTLTTVRSYFRSARDDDDRRRDPRT